MLLLSLCRRSRVIHLPCLQKRTLFEVFDTTRTKITREDDLFSGVWASPKSQVRRQRHLKDNDFVDHIIMTISAGKLSFFFLPSLHSPFFFLLFSGRGGDGCVAFHKPATARAPRHPYRLGPPSGGNGGRGGDIYLLPDESLTSLVSVPRKVNGKPGTNGSGEWRIGKKGKDRIVRVPVGTVVRVIGWGYKPLQDKPYFSPELGRLQEGGAMDGMLRACMWVHYPGCAEANLEREEFREAEKWLEREERRRMREGKNKWGPWVEEGREIDLSAELKEVVDVVDTVNEPLGKKRKESLGYLIAAGGAGGLGNPHFSANLNTGSTPSSTGFARSPKFATRGVYGEVMTLSLEVKTNADVALVGRCSVGKSTLIRALTGGRVKSDVGEWEGVTRGVVRGVVRIAQREGGERIWEGELGDVRVFDESMNEGGGKRRAGGEDDRLDEFSPVPTKPGHGFDLYESFRFTITDNPGFVQAKDDQEQQELAPITQTILRSIERAKVLVYVVDLSGDTPWDELGDVIREVARGRNGGEAKAMVVANKADLLVASEGSEEEVANAQAKLKRLEEYVKREMDGVVEVVPVSAKWGMNLGKVVRSLEVLLKAGEEFDQHPV